MRENLLVVLAVILGGIYGYFAEGFAEKIIAYKEEKREKSYERYPYNPLNNRILNIIVGALLFGISFYYFNIYKALLSIIFAILGIVIVTIDKKVRIIPNELVLVIFLLGLFNQILTKGFQGLKSGLLALILTSIIFFLSAFITKKLSGSIGVGAGDVKLAMAISLYAGIEGVFDFYYGIAIFLALYVLLGLFTKTIKMGHTFPMGTQIIGGFMVVIYGEAILDFISKVY